MRRKNEAVSRKTAIQASGLEISEAEILLAWLLKKPRLEIMAHPEKRVPATALKRLAALAKKRSQGFPLAYLTGKKEFFSLDFKVSPAVLVPRPETEIMIEAALNIIKDQPISFILDIGTGSGAIIISLAKEIKRIFPEKYRRLKFLAGDISLPALRIAQENLRRHRLSHKVRLRRSSLLENCSDLAISRPWLICANLPYLTKDQIAASPSISHEPRLALNGGRDGLSLYRRLFKQIASFHLTSSFILAEIDPSQTKAIKLLAKNTLKAKMILIKPDLAGHKRLAIIKI